MKENQLLEENNKKEESKPKTINSIFSAFKHNLESIKFYFEKFGDIAENEDEGGLKKATEFSQRLLEILEIDIEKSSEEQESKEVPVEKIIEFAREAKKSPSISLRNFEILSSSSFLILNNYFEYLISDLLTYYYTNFKNFLNSKEFKISLQDMNEYESIEELENFLILKEVETMLIELSFDSLLKHFNQKLKINLSDEIVAWDRINECRERRHLIVHNSSIVNKKYITRTENPFNLKIGDRVHITNEYFEKAYNEFKLAGTLLLFDCWGKWDNATSTKAIEVMIEKSFQRLLEGKYDNCLKLSKYIEKIEPRDEKQEDLLLRSKFNKCISLFHLGKRKDLKKELSKIKVGTAEPIFKLAHSILSDKPDEQLLELISQTKKLDDIDLETYQEWPLFDPLRKNEELNIKVLKILSEEQKN